jgi:hypothetical protein
MASGKKDISSCTSISDTIIPMYFWNWKDEYKKFVLPLNK